MNPDAWSLGDSGFLDIDGARLEFAAWGPSPQTAPTLVLLHEGLGCVALWRDFPQKLAAATGCGVFAYSRAGYGRSSPVSRPRPLDYMTHEAVAVLPRVLQAAGIARAVLIGHSDGATIALIHAGAGAASVAAIALIAPHLFPEPEGLSAIRAAERAFGDGDLRARLGKYHSDVDGAFYGWSRAWLDPGFMTESLAPYVERWRAPALVVQGDADPYGTLKQVEAILARAPGAETLILTGCGHAPQFERPDATLAALARFSLRHSRA